MSINILSTGSFITNDILDNEYLSSIVDTSDEWIVERTGIKTRHISKTYTTEELAYEACLNAINKTDIEVNKIGLIIFASVTADTIVPSSAFTLSGKLGINECICFDLNAACSGFVYSVSVAKSLMETMDIEYAVVVGSERLTKNVDWKDRSSCILFGDASGCVILKNDKVTLNDVKPNCSLSIEKTIIGGKYDTKKYLMMNSLSSIGGEYQKYIKMNGRQIYKFATDIGPKIINELLQDTNISIEDIAFVVPHQANSRIIDTMSEKSGIKRDKWYTNLEKYGNTSAASVPLAMDEAIQYFDLQNNVGKYIISIAFGGGLSYGGILIKIN